MEKKYLFLLVAVFWLVVIFVFVGYKEYTLNTGTEVLLKTAPVDPWDFFRGDYVTLRYEITRVPVELQEGKTVYVQLKQEGKYHVYDGYSLTRPDGLFIKGDVVWSRNGESSLMYGIESYFVPENTGGDIERMRTDIDVLAAINGRGHAIIKELILPE